MTYIIGLDPTDRTSAPQHRAGSLGFDAAGAEYIYVAASAAIANGDCVAVDSNFAASPITKTLADAMPVIGFATASFASGQWGWVVRRGVGFRANVLANTTVASPLYTTATAGNLSHVATSQTMIHGVCATTAGASNGLQTMRAAVLPSVVRGTVGA